MDWLVAMKQSLTNMVVSELSSPAPDTSPAPSSTGWIPVLEPMSWVAGIVAGLAVVATFVLWIRKRYKQTERAKRKLLQERLSLLNLGAPQARVSELLEPFKDALTTVRSGPMDVHFRPRGGIFEQYDFPDAAVKVVLEEGVVQVISITGKSKRFRMRVRGSNQIPSLELGSARFGEIPWNSVAYYQSCNGATKRMNWYMEYRGFLGETDPNVWVYCWHTYGFTRDVRWFSRHVPSWLTFGSTEAGKLAASQIQELEVFRRGLHINCVIRMRQDDNIPMASLIAYLPDGE